MGLKLGAALAGGILILLTAQGCVFGGGDSAGPSGVSAGSIPTATLPATLTDPILLGQSQAGGGATGATGGGSSGQTYTIKSGDTLGGIAASLGVPGDQQAAWIAEVLRLNGISDARLLAVGQELTLPRTATASPTPRVTGTPGAGAATTATPNRTSTPSTGATPAASSPTPKPTTTTGSGRTYTVVSGDTPLVIAEKLGVPSAQQVTWANELVTLNGINPNTMQVGAVLQLPAGTP